MQAPSPVSQAVFLWAAGGFGGAGLRCPLPPAPSPALRSSSAAGAFPAWPPGRQNWGFRLQTLDPIAMAIAQAPHPCQRNKAHVFLNCTLLKSGELITHHCAIIISAALSNFVLYLWTHWGENCPHSSQLSSDITWDTPQTPGESPLMVCSLQWECLRQHLSVPGILESTHIPSSRRPNCRARMPGHWPTVTALPSPLLTPVPAAQSSPEQRGDVSVLDLEAFLSYRLLNVSPILNFK